MVKTNIYGQKWKEENFIMEPKYKRILLKLSGEALAGDQRFGLNHEVIAPVVDQIVQLHSLGVQVGLVIGGGNAKTGVNEPLHGVAPLTNLDIFAEVHVHTGGQLNHLRVVENRQVQRGNPGTLVDQPHCAAHMGGYGVDRPGDYTVGLCQEKTGEEGVGCEQTLTGGGDGLHQILEQHGEVCLGLGCLGVYVQSQTFQNY